MLTINSSYHNIEKQITNYVTNFNVLGKILIAGNRNTIKLFHINDNLTLNIKSFKKPFIINQIIYGYLRKSKAKRSFEHAKILIDKGIGTPNPIAYNENISLFGLLDSYYICEHIEADLTFRELVETEYPDAENILRQFIHFTYKLHENGIEFKDHTPGNTLIKSNQDGTYAFFLVDLNRMNFHKTMSFNLRMKNLSKITPQKKMIEIMSNEYSKISNENEKIIFEAMWNYTENFQLKLTRKKNLKKKLKFWKK
jgi:hypothetical protein